MPRSRCSGTTRRGTPCALPGTACSDDNHSTSPLCHLHVPRRDCAICLQDIAPSTQYRVGCAGHHVFHKTCINGWFLEHDTCPMCRAEVVNPLPIIRLDDLIKQQQQQQISMEMTEIMEFVRETIETDETLIAHLFFNSNMRRLDNIIFWGRGDVHLDTVGFIYIEGSFRNTVSRWW